ncbi:MAG: lysylphosphatidylglycerol synthase transmembrane domain-containing protein, partial [Gammaproteobacteria bacterium]
MNTGVSGAGNRRMARFFKIAVSVLLLALLVYALDISRIVDSVREVRWWAIPLAVILQLLLFTLANVRWWVLLNHHACGYRLASLLAPYFIGIFFNNVLPTTLGGSLFRMYYIYRDRHSAVVAAAPIITERLLG